MNYASTTSNYHSRYDYIKLKVYYCDPSNYKATCQINNRNIMLQTQFTLKLSNTYFDIDNFGLLAQYFLDNRFFKDLESVFKTKTGIFIRKNKASLIDDYLQIGQYESLTFYEIVDLREQILVENIDI